MQLIVNPHTQVVTRTLSWKFVSPNADFELLNRLAVASFTASYNIDRLRSQNFYFFQDLTG